MNLRKWSRLSISSVIVFLITLFLMRGICIQPLPYKYCLEISLLAAAAQFFAGWLAIRRIP